MESAHRDREAELTGNAEAYAKEFEAVKAMVAQGYPPGSPSRSSSAHKLAVSKHSNAMLTAMVDDLRKEKLSLTRGKEQLQRCVDQLLVQLSGHATIFKGPCPASTRSHH